MLVVIVLAGCRSKDPDPPARSTATPASAPAAEAPTPTSSVPAPPAQVAATEDPDQGGEQARSAQAQPAAAAASGAGVRAHVATEPAAGPIHEAEPEVSGDIDRALIKRVVARYLPKVRKCYQDRLRQDPTARGTVTTRFTFGLDGKVTSAKAEGIHADLERCIVAALMTMKFPARTTGGEITIGYPFTLQPHER